MAIPERYPGFRRVRRSARAVALVSAMLAASCATAPRPDSALGLDRPQVQYSTGRMTVVLVDEFGIALPGMRVDLSWEEPSFYKTSAFTNRDGQVSFAGVPELAEVSVHHPGGNYTGTFLVPQSGRPELRLMLDTMGGGQQMREREMALRAPRTQIQP
jgi:hypothetical protein